MGERIKGFTREYIEKHAKIQIQQYDLNDGNKEREVSVIVLGFFKGVQFVGDTHQTREGDLVQQICRMLPLAIDDAVQWGDLDYHLAEFKETFPQLFNVTEEEQCDQK